MSAIWFHEPKDRRARRRSHIVPVKVIDIRKNTARIEYRRWDGKTIRRFTKVARIQFPEATR